MRAPRVLGHVTDADAKARRLAILRALWLDDAPRSLIAARLSVAEQTVSWMARQAGLPPRHRMRVGRSVVALLLAWYFVAWSSGPYVSTWATIGPFRNQSDCDEYRKQPAFLKYSLRCWEGS